MGADNLGNNRKEVLDKLLRGSFIACLPALQASVDVDGFIHVPSSLANARIMQQWI
jgi:hypothetical protein